MNRSPMTCVSTPTGSTGLEEIGFEPPVILSRVVAVKEKRYPQPVNVLSAGASGLGSVQVNMLSRVVPQTSYSLPQQSSQQSQQPTMQTTSQTGSQMPPATPAPPPPQRQTQTQPSSIAYVVVPQDHPVVDSGPSMPSTDSSGQSLVFLIVSS